MKVAVKKINLDQLIEKLDKLNRKCKIKRGESPYSEKDARSLIFDLLSLYIQNWLLNVTLSKQLFDSEFYEKNGLGAIDDESMRKVHLNYFDDAKNSFFFLVFMQLENYFRLVANAQGINNWKITKLVEETIRVFDLNSDNIELWKIVRNLRNSIHNGGFSNHNGDPINYKGKTYEFKKNQPINYGSPSDYLFFIEELINNLIVELNLKSSNIKIIEHNYANISFEREE